MTQIREDVTKERAEIYTKILRHTHAGECLLLSMFLPLGAEKNLFTHTNHTGTDNKKCGHNGFILFRV